MSWQDMFIARPLTENEIATALAAVFEVMVGHILVVDDHFDWTSLNEDIKIVCTYYHVPGKFPTRLDITLIDSALTPAQPFTVEGNLAQHLGTDVIVAGTEVNPYVWVLIHDQETMQKVLLNADKLDAENPEIVIEHYHEPLPADLSLRA